MSAPSGRSARLRLAHRIDVAARGCDLLERKQRILAGEVTRLRLQTRRSLAEWEDAGADAARWLRRCLALDGAERVTAVADPGAEPAVVQITWRAAMGVVYPGEAVAMLPAARATAGSSALALAAQAHRRAVEAAARHAAAERALALVTVELDVTRLRQQAIERRLLPRLAGQLHHLEAQLDELEREENVRLRWAAGTRSSGRGR